MRSWKISHRKEIHDDGTRKARRQEETEVKVRIEIKIEAIDLLLHSERRVRFFVSSVTRKAIWPENVRKEEDENVIIVERKAI